MPFGPQTRIGVVWDRVLGESDKPIALKKLKTVADRLDVPPLPVISLRFAEWIANYTLAPLGMVLRMMMGAQSAFEPLKARYRRAPRRGREPAAADDAGAAKRARSRRATG